MIDPFGNVPIFTALTEGFPRAAVKRVAIKACLFAFLATLAFGFFGNAIFHLFQISINSLKIVGGIIFFIMGFEMLQGHLSKTKTEEKLDTEELKEHLDDLALTPLGIPLLCGPGAITNAIILMNKTGGDWQLKISFVVGTLLVMLATLGCFLGAAKLTKIFGATLNKVLLRLMGLLLMVIAVESFFGGLKPVVQEIFTSTFSQ